MASSSAKHAARIRKIELAASILGITSAVIFLVSAVEWQSKTATVLPPPNTAYTTPTGTYAVVPLP